MAMQTITREQAARLLRRTRAAIVRGDERAGELIGWACAAMGDRRTVRCLKIDHLLANGHYDSADAMIARSLMQDEDHPLMRLRFARSLRLQGRVKQADAEIQKTLAVRPKHCASLKLGAEIAAEIGHFQRAVFLWTLAVDERPGDRELRCGLVQACIDAGMARQAAAQLEMVKDPPTILQARVLCAQHRVLEAIEALECSTWNNRSEDEWCELIDCLEDAGDVVRLRKVISEIVEVKPTALLRASQALLSLGEFAEAAERLERVIEGDVPLPLKREAMMSLVIARAMDAERSATDENVQGTLETMMRSELGTTDNASGHAALWLRGLLGRCIRSQASGKKCGADPSTSVLQPMLRDAVRQLERAIVPGRANAAEVDRAAIARLRDVCLAAMGESGVPVSVDAIAGRQNSVDEARDEQSLRRAA